MRLVGIYHLLCDHCNLLFTGFVVPGTLRRRRKQQRPKHIEQHSESPISSQQNQDTYEHSEIVLPIPCRDVIDVSESGFFGRDVWLKNVIGALTGGLRNSLISALRW